MMAMLKRVGANGMLIALTVFITLGLSGLYRGINPTDANHIVIINRDGIDSIKVGLSIADLAGKVTYEHTMMLTNESNSALLSFRRAWHDGTIVLRHDGIVERSEIYSDGRYSPTLFIEVRQKSASQAGWGKIPSLLHRDRESTVGIPNGAHKVFTFAPVLNNP